jgi:hypothetical protein
MLRHVERRLVDHVTRGELLDLAGDGPVDEAAMRSWDSSRTVRARVLRDILRGRLAPDPDPHGLRLRGARIDGRLDLEDLTTGVGVELFDCLLCEGLVVRDATLPAVVLSGCRLDHPSESPLAADRLTTALLFLDRAVVTAHSEAGAVKLVGAHVGNLDCTDARIRNDGGPALAADRLQVDQDVVLSGGFEAIGAGELAAVGLIGANLGNLDCTDATIRNDSGPALAADTLRVDREVFLRGGFQAIGAGELGAVRLPGAHLGGLDCTDARIRNNRGPALTADGLQVDGSVFLRGGFRAIGAGEDGAVRLTGAHSGGQLDCSNATIRNHTGPALHTDTLRVDQDVYLWGFKAVGAGELGAVRLPGAHLGGLLDCTGARIRNNRGPALAADRLQADRDVFLRGFKAVGAGAGGAVRLPGAHLGGLLDCTGASMCNETGPALVAYSLQVDQKVLLEQFEAIGAGDDETLNLLDVRVGGVLVFAPARLDNTTDPQGRLALDGLTYAGLPLRSARLPQENSVGGRLPQEIPVDEWLCLLCKGTKAYAAQPYQQFAAAYRAAGHDSKVRRILIAQRQAQIDRGLLPGRAERAWAWLTWLTLGYGYQPWRALIALVVVAAIAVGLALTLGAHGGLARTDPQPPTATQCSVVERVAVGLDLGLPLVKTGTPAQCEPTTSSSGNVLTVAGWGLQLLAWAFATLFVAGFTGAVRKT